MNQETFNHWVQVIHQYKGVEEVFLLDREGAILFKSKDFPLNVEESKAILKAWKEKEGALTFQSDRYAILKNDEIQLAAKNIAGGKGNVVGSVTKDGDYLLVHTSKETGLILLEWSIFINKVAWEQITE